jgi:hypothetical protein
VTLLASIRAGLARTVDGMFGGSITPWVYAVLRIGFAALLLVRLSDVLRPVVSLDHHLWVRGLDFDWSIEQAPYLTSPLLPGLALGRTATRALVVARTVLGVALLVGVRSRPTALLLALVGYLSMFADRYRYFHHLHLLFLVIAWLSLAPLDDRLSLERLAARGRASVPASPMWPLQFVRAVLVSVYVAAGTSKLQSAWLNGETLGVLDRLHVLDGVTWRALRAIASHSTLAWLICLAELTLPVLLLVRHTRKVGVIAALVFHALVSAVMPVMTFGVEMALLALAFWPDRSASA